VGFSHVQDSTGQYVFGDPHTADDSGIWGVPVFVSSHMTAGSFVALDRLQAATVHMRAEALITLSDSDDDNFTKNLATMLVEARLGFAVHHPLGIISGLLNGA
jgi:HK97 family phage major capsid protein